MAYPASIDTFSTVHAGDPRTSPSLSKRGNDLATAIINTESTLGTNPQGSFGTVKDRIAALEEGSGDPAGVIKLYAGISTPSGYLLCNGASYLRTTYPNLFAALGGTSSPWGLPDSTHFKVPNLQLKFPLGTNGGSFAIGDFGGDLGHKHTGDPHTHHVPGQTKTSGAASQSHDVQSGNGSTKPDPSHTHDTTMSAVTTDGQTSSGDTGSADPPYVVVQYIIKAA